MFFNLQPFSEMGQRLAQACPKPIEVSNCLLGYFNLQGAETPFSFLNAMSAAEKALFDLENKLEHSKTRENQICQIPDEYKKTPTKTYHPKHTSLSNIKIPFPETGLEHALLQMAVIQKAVPQAEIPDEAIVKAALQTPPPECVWDETVEDRYYLPQEIEALSEDQRPAAVLKRLLEIKSTHKYLKD